MSEPETQENLLTITITNRRTGRRTVQRYGLTPALARELAAKMDEIVAGLPPARVTRRQLTRLSDGSPVYEVAITGQPSPAGMAFAELYSGEDAQWPGYDDLAELPHLARLAEIPVAEEPPPGSAAGCLMEVER